MQRYIISFKGERDTSILKGAENIEEPSALTSFVICDMEMEDIRELLDHELIDFIEEDEEEEIELDAATTASSDKTTYAYKLMDIKKFHDRGYKGKGVKVAVLDTGVQKHQNLDVKGGFNAYDKSKPYDANLAKSHGTKVAGVVNMQGNNSGMIGIAPEADLYAVRIDDGSGSLNRTIWSAQIKGINWAVENGMDAVNCSFSSPKDSKSREKAFQNAHDEGVVIFCSAGNRQKGVDKERPTMVAPATYPFTIANANVDSNKKRYKSSSTGRWIDFSSGGTNIKSTTIDKNKKISKRYKEGTGTSYASPAVMGVYALYKQMYPNDSRETLLQRMAFNAERLGRNWEYGAGLPQFPKTEYENIQIKVRL